MLSKADSIPGQGVGSAYIEQVHLVQNETKKCFEININSRKQADIYHYHSINPSYLWQMNRKKGIHVVHVHFIPETIEGTIKLPGLTQSIYKKYITCFYKQADYLVVVNPTFIEPLLKRGISRNQIVYIPNYVSKERFYKLNEDEIKKTKDRHHINPNSFVVLGVGQVQTKKGVKEFVEIAKKLPHMVFVWCGGFSFGAITDGYKELKGIVSNPPQNVLFTGIIHRAEMNSMYNMADVLFMPSYHELFPMAILEAANTEKPILLRELDLYKPILWNHYFSASDNNGFIKQLVQLSEDKTYYEEGMKRSKKISQYYSKEYVLKQWIDFYSRIVKEKREKK